MIKCKKCWMLKISEKQKCACNAKKFNEEKLIKKANPQPIAKVSEKKKAEVKERWSLIDFYSKLAKWHFNEHWDWKCQYCGWKFNITDFVDNRVCFAHILAKWDALYKHLATFKNNLAIVCGEACHKDMDSEICQLKLKNTLKLKIENWEKIDVWNLSSYL